MRQWAGDDSLPRPRRSAGCRKGRCPQGSGGLFFTAGHCVNGGLDRFGNPIKIVNVVFVPGHDHGAAPHGVFPVRAFAWSATYSGPTSGTDDDAVLALDPVDGRHVADVAGTQDVTFAKPPSPVDTTILGHPVSRLAGGEALVSCGRPATPETNSVASAWRTDCDLAGGSSGGRGCGTSTPRPARAPFRRHQPGNDDRRRRHARSHECRVHRPRAQAVRASRRPLNPAIHFRRADDHVQAQPTRGSPP
ncbi:MAG: hypothetical protein QOI78_4235 [Actinomycetota bacterium]|nr:hypothetical protein [Actinomycetota bacterium]